MGLNMNVSSTTTTQVTTSLGQSDTVDAVSIAVLRKALDLQGSSAVALIQALPQPSLATQGSVGTKVNTFA
ncbi:MAG: YjfB family protein [Burkholderiales bacterium]